MPLGRLRTVTGFALAPTVGHQVLDGAGVLVAAILQLAHPRHTGAKLDGEVAGGSGRKRPHSAAFAKHLPMFWHGGGLPRVWKQSCLQPP